MVIRIELRTNNYPMSAMLSGPNGYGLGEDRHYDSSQLHLSVTKEGGMYEIDNTKTTIGPPIVRKGRVRGICDKLPMRYVQNEGVKFLYQSKFLPNPPNSTQTCTEQNLKNEEAIVREYCEWRGGEYLPPAFARHVGGHSVNDDGGIRIKD